MKIILTETVPTLGTIGDIIEVKPGYARNFLIPQGKALLAEGRKSKELKHRLQYLDKLRLGAIAEANEQAIKLKAISLQTKKKAAPGGRLFGSVSNRDIQKLLEDNGFSVDRHAVLLKEPIKNVGSHDVIVKLHNEVRVELVVKVAPEVEEIQEEQTEPEEQVSEKLPEQEQVESAAQ